MTMLYKLGGDNKHYDKKLGHVNFEYIIVPEQEIKKQLDEGWFLTLEQAVEYDKLKLLDLEPVKEVIIEDKKKSKKVADELDKETDN